MLRSKVRAVVFISLATSTLLAIAWMTPASFQEKAASQEAKTEAPAAQNSSPEPLPHPEAATTTKDVKIPVDELKVLVKPLTLSELQNEVAGWMLILQSKAKEISAAEVTIRRQNAAISYQQEGIDKLEKANKALEEAEQAQKGATPGSPQYEAATKKLEEAKEHLKQAQDAVEKAKTDRSKIEQNETSREVLDQAKKTASLDVAKQALGKLKADRDKLEASSPTYADATQKVDRLTEAIAALEKAQEVQKNANPDSPEATTASKLVDQASAKLDQVLKDIGAADVNQSSEQPSSQNLNNATATLKNTNIKSNLEERVASTTDVPGESPQNLDQKQQQLGNTTDKLQQSAEEEKEAKNNLVSTVIELNSQLTAIGDRLSVVLDELDRKGGDSKPYRQYLKAVSSVDLDTKDTQGMGVRILSWISSDEGGLRWATNLAKFAGIVLLSFIVSQVVGLVANNSLRRFKTSTILRQFIVMTIKRGGVVVGILLGLTALEVSLGPVLALMGGVSFVLAFALQSNLGNLASGLMIMLNKPFDVGDEVKLAGLWGWVDEITLANTKIKGFAGQIFSIPNNQVWGDTIENLTHAQDRKVMITLRVSLEEDLNRVQHIVLDVMKSHPKVNKDPAPSTFVWQIEEYYISLFCGAWTKTEGFWDVYQDIVCGVKERFDNEGIKLAAIPRTDINLYQKPGVSNKVLQIEPEAFN